MPKSKLEIRDGTHGLWIQPVGWPASAIYIAKPGTEAMPLIPLQHQTQIKITAQGQDGLQPAEARSLAKALIAAADLAESIQREYDKRTTITEKPCSQKPKREISSPAGRARVARRTRRS